MLIEIVFVRYRGLCDLLIYTIGFMHDDFFFYFTWLLIKWMVVTIDTKLVCLWNIQMFIFILSTNVNKYSNVGILYICIYFWSISNANTWNNSKFSRASIFCHHHQYYCKKVKLYQCLKSYNIYRQTNFVLNVITTNFMLLFLLWCGKN